MSRGTRGASKTSPNPPPDSGTPPVRPEGFGASGPFLAGCDDGIFEIEQRITSDFSNQEGGSQVLKIPVSAVRFRLWAPHSALMWCLHHRKANKKPVQCGFFVGRDLVPPHPAARPREPKLHIDLHKNARPE